MTIELVSVTIFLGYAALLLTIGVIAIWGVHTKRSKTQELKRASARLQEKIDELSSFYALSQIFSPELDIHHAMNSVAEGVLKMCRAEKATIFLLRRAAKLELVGGAGLASAEPGDLSLELDNSSLGEVISTKKPFIHNNLATRIKNEPDFIRDEEVRSVIHVPILSGKEILGVVSAYNRLDRGDFSYDSLMLLYYLAKQIGWLMKAESAPS